MARRACLTRRVLTVAALVVLVPAAVALAGWMIQLGSGATAAALAGDLPTVSQPTATREAADVAITWPAASLPDGRAVAGYVVSSRHSVTGVARNVGGTCAGVLTSTQCTDPGVPSGTWTWSVAAAEGSWRGPASPQSNAVEGGSVSVTGTNRALGAGATGQSVGITGTGFATGATVAIGGSGVTVQSVTVVSGTQLTVVLNVAANAAPGSRSVTVTNPDESTGSCASCFTVNAGPTLTAASPSARARATTNQTVTLSGTNLNTGLAVAFSGTGITVNSTTRTSATTAEVNVSVAADAPTGTRNITVTNTDGGSATCSACFSVTASATATSAAPSTMGQGAISETVTITGTNFNQGAAVAFSGTGITVESTSRVSATQLTAVVSIAPTALTGLRSIQVDNADGLPAVTCANCFTVATGPTITSTSPTARPRGTSVTVQINGTGYSGVPSVAISGTGVTITSVASPNTTRVNVSLVIDANAPLGARDLTVRNADLGAAVCSGCFTVNEMPTISELSPRFAARGQTLTVSVLGTGFQSGATVGFAGPAAVTVNSTTFVSANRIDVNITTNNQTSAAGDYNATVTNPDTGAVTCTGCFTVGNPPTVTSTSPNAAGVGAAGLDVTVNGTNFAAGASVSFSGTGITVNSTTFLSSTQVRANVTIAANAATGARDVTVTNTNGGAGSCAACFAVNPPPTLTSASPASRAPGATNQNIVLTGTNFLSGSVASFSGTGITVNSTTFNSATQVTANITVAANAAVGTRDITITKLDGGQATCLGCFTINPLPTISELSPRFAARAQTLTVSVLGTGFQSGATVGFAGPAAVTLNSTTFVSANRIDVNITTNNQTSAAGDYNATVTNPDTGAVTCTGCFTVGNPPTVTSTSPNAAGVGASALDVTVNGTNFAAGASVSFSGTGITVNSTTFLSSTQVRANVTIAANAATGARDVTVTNTNGGTGSCAGCFTVNPPPTVTSASPNNRAQGAVSQSITLTGTGFRSGATASFSGTGITVNSTTFNSATQLTANITISAGASTGSRSITVTNADGGTPGTCVGCFTVNPAPTITAVSPIFATRSQSLNVTITGTNFVAGASANFGAGITVSSTTVDSATQITASITVGSTATLGTYNVTVNNTDAGSATCLSCFNVGLQPTLTSASPSAAGRGATNLNVTLTGTNFANGLTASFSGTGITVNSTTFNTSTSATVNITVSTGANLGARDITVTNTNGGTTTCAGCFTVLAPATVTSASPNNAGQGATLNVSVTGTNFIAGAGVSFSGTGITVNSTTVNSTTSLTANVSIASTATTGLRNLTVTNGDGQQVTCSNCFTVNPGPTITSVSPSAFSWKTNTTVTITGTNFNAGVAVTSPGGTVTNVTRVSSTQITAVLNYQTKGSFDITVTNTDGGTTTCTNCVTTS
jgi:hypothetical protein